MSSLCSNAISNDNDNNNDTNYTKSVVWVNSRERETVEDSANVREVQYVQRASDKIWTGISAAATLEVSC